MSKHQGIEAGWLTIREAVEKTGYSATYLRHLARRGIIRGARVGRDWFVNLEAVLDYRRKMETLGAGKHNPWRVDLKTVGRGRTSERRFAAERNPVPDEGIKGLV